MTFTVRLQSEAQSVLESIYQHPFIQELAEGTLQAGPLIHYVKQDHEYLQAMIQTRALAIAKCTRREDVKLFHSSISYVLNSEGQAHESFCKAAGVQYEEITGAALAPAAHHYVQHMLSTAHSGTIGDIIAVTLPCPWIYLELGRRLLREVQPGRDHRFFEWITFYGEDSGKTVDNYCRRLDEIAETARPDELERMRQLFLTSCKLEYMFFDAAYRMEEWPV